MKVLYRTMEEESILSDLLKDKIYNFFELVC